MAAGLQIVGLLVLLAANAVSQVQSPPTGGDLAGWIAAAAPGSTIRVAPGVYRGPLVIARPIVLLGGPGVVIDGGGRGTIVLIHADDVTFSGFTVRASGDSISHEDTAIMALGSHEKILNNTLQDVLFGIYLKSSNGSVVSGNRISGKPLPLPVRGDGIRLWYSMNGVVEHNRVRNVRDNILWFSHHARVEDNFVEGSRYGLHLMYDKDVRIFGNTLAENFVGAFMMYSSDIQFKRNVLLANRGVSGYGIGVKNIDDLVAEDNRFLGNEVGIFMNSSPSELGARNIFRRNVVAFNDLGISLDPSNQGANIFTLNSFVENIQQVSNTGGGELAGDSFSDQGRGNFWSDYTGYPAGTSGIGAVPYQIRSQFDVLSDEYDHLKLFRFSPSAEAVDLAAKAFPLFRPHEVLTDPEPLIQPVKIHAAALPRPRSLALVLTAGMLLGFGGLLAIGIALVSPRPRKKGANLAMSNPIHPPLEILSLRKNFGLQRALRGITLTVERGRAVALWGDNGAGKSTTIKCIMGLLDYTGIIMVEGIDAQRQGKAARRKIGYVPQELRFYNDWSLRRTMEFYSDLKRASREEVQERLKEVGLEAQIARPVRALSGGMRQRLALAIALLGRPEILLLDEFTASLDAEARAGLLEVLWRLRGRGMSILFSTHRQEEVRALADRVEWMHRGEIAASLTIEDFLKRSAPHEEVEAGRQTAEVSR